MENVTFLMETINITQRENGGYSHKKLEAWDIAGADTKIEDAYAPCTVRVLSILPYETTGFANTVFFGSCDEKGNQCPVRLGNKKESVLTFALTHSNDISDIKVGKIYKSGEPFYKEGTTGNATGNHIHVEVGEGWQTKKYKRSDGIWEITGCIPINGVFYFLEGWNKVKNLNGVSLPVVKYRSAIFSIVDAQKAFQIVAGKRKATGSDLQFLDINGDGVIDLSDVMKIFKIVAGD
ncbi:MAG: hypothetical protein DBX47_00625 [Clostridiales bacterium]|nr:MAG: hypothetical protein DBX47_00625 [Clostridiales bacterium]